MHFSSSNSPSRKLLISSTCIAEFNLNTRNSCGVFQVKSTFIQSQILIAYLSNSCSHRLSQLLKATPRPLVLETETAVSTKRIKFGLPKSRCQLDSTYICWLTKQLNSKNTKGILVFFYILRSLVQWMILKEKTYSWSSVWKGRSQIHWGKILDFRID